MKTYAKEGVLCTKEGYPICCLDDKVCDVEGCRYWVNFMKTKNCVLRVKEGDGCTLQEIADAFKLSRERVRQIEEELLLKLGNAYKHMREELHDR
jgi:hypothetical protein